MIFSRFHLHLQVCVNKAEQKLCQNTSTRACLPGCHILGKAHLKGFQSSLVDVTKGQVWPVSHPHRGKLLWGTLHVG